MRADIRTVIIEPWEVFDVIVEVTEGDVSQVYRVQWRYTESEAYCSKFTECDGGDPRRALGKALQELGRSLEISHGYELVQPHQCPGCAEKEKP